MPKVCVIGAGAIGGFLGARLAQGHADVSVVARGATLQALQTRGWVLETAGGSRAAAVRAVSDPAQLSPQDVVVLAVKAYALPQVTAWVRPLMGPHTLVIPALNGVPWWFTGGTAARSSGRPCLEEPLSSVDAGGQIHADIPAAAVIGAVVYPACSCPAPGVTRHHSGSRLVLGEPDAPAGAAASTRLDALVAWLRSAGFDAEASRHIRAEVWKKLLGNACFNPVSMITGTATDQMIDDPAVYRLFTAMMQELLAVGRSMGLDPGIEVAQRIAITRALGGVKTSMLQDAEAGRPVEIDAILGAACELARRLDVITPALDTVYALARRRALTFGHLPASDHHPHGDLR